MDTSRRMVLAGGASALLGPGMAHAAEPSLVIQPVTPSSGQDTAYSRLANQGPYGRPPGPVRLEPVAGLRIDAWLPPNMPVPRLVVFSHGELVLPSAYDPLLGHWASHGFGILAPIHDDSVLVNGLQARHLDAHGESWDFNGVLDDADAWRGRPAACRAVLDSLAKSEAATRVRFAADRPIVCGHAFGSYTAQLLTGTMPVLAAGGERLNETDPRFYGSILMCPQGQGVLGLDARSFATQARPSLSITGVGDNDATGQEPAKRLDAFSLPPPGNRHLAWMSRVDSTVYSGQQAFPGTPKGNVFQDVLAATTAFLRAYGDYDQAVFRDLAGTVLQEQSGNRMSVRYR